MKRLWAPWRMAYIKGAHATATGEAGGGGAPPTATGTGCIFCDLPAEGPERARANLILELGPGGLVMLNRYPYQNGHLMVVPRRHVARLAMLDVEERTALAELLSETIARLEAVLKPDGLNVGMNLGRAAGAGIADHLHWHVVPRWNGDHNFMTVLSDTRVISEQLEATYDTLAPSFRAGPAPVHGSRAPR